MRQHGQAYRPNILPRHKGGPVGTALTALFFLLFQTTTSAQCPTQVDVLQPISCSGADDGILSVAVPDGIDPADVYWLQNNDTLFGATQADLGPGSYLVFVPGCPALGATLNEPFNFFISAAVTQLPTCDAPCSGIVTVTPSFGVEPITYTWSHDATENSPVGSGICEQVVLVSAVDANGCADQDILTVDIPAIEVLTFPTPPSCFGFSDGEVAAVATGGLGGGFTFEWEDAQGNQVGSGPDLSGLTSGGYLVTATDTGGCSAEQVAFLDAPPPVDVDMAATGVSCFGAMDGSAAANFSDAVDFAWTGPGGFALSGPGLDSLDALAPGTYTVLVTASDGCVGEGVVEVPTPDSLTAEAFLDPPSCPEFEDGVVGAVGSGGTPGYEVTWTLEGGDEAEGPFLSGVAAGTYSYFLVDANGCTTEGTAVLEDPEPVSVTLELEAPLCAEGPLANGGSIIATVTGGLAPYAAAWLDVNSGSVVAEGLSATNLPAGTYGLGLMDLLGCIVDTVVTLDAPDSLLVEVNATPPSCFGEDDGMVEAIAFGGTPDYVFLWGGDVPPTFAASLNGLESGQYNLEVTDVNGCVVTASAILLDPEPLVLSVEAVPVGCSGTDGAASAEVTGGTAPYTLQWLDAGGTALSTGDSIVDQSAGTYTAVALDAQGCVAQANVDIEAFPPLEIVASLGPLDCTDGSAPLNLTFTGGAPGAAVSLWADGSALAFINGMALSPGSYTAVVEDERGCTDDTSWVIHPPLELVLESFPFGCNGPGSIQADALGGDPDAMLTFGGGSLGAPDVVEGPGASWEVAAEGQYPITVSNGDCEVTASVGVEGIELFDWTVVTEPFACEDAPGLVTVTVAGGLEPLVIEGQSVDGAITWTTLSSSGLPSGNYSVTVVDAAGCERDTTVGIEALAPISLAVTATDVECHGAGDGAIEVVGSGGTPPLTLGALGPEGPLAVPLVDLLPGVYVVGAIDVRGCTADTTVVLSEPDPIEVGSGVQPESCSGTMDGAVEVMASGGTEPLTTQWAGGPASASWSGLSAGTYSWTVTDANGCDSTGTLEVITQGALTAEAALLPVVCEEGQPSGSVVITVEGNGLGAVVLLGGLPADQAEVSDTSGTWTWNNLAAGDYGWTASLGAGCSTAGQVAVDLPAALSFGLVVAAPSCAGGLGAVEVNPEGGMAPVAVQWEGINVEGDTLTGAGPQGVQLPEGTYVWSLQDASGCTLDTVVDMVALSSGLGLDQDVLQPSCGGALAGEAVLTPFGGLPPYHVVVQGAADTTFLPFLVPGSYPLVLTDSVGCEFQDTVLVVPASEFTLFAEVTPASCANSEDGEIVLTTTNGTGQVDFTFNGPFGALPVGDTIVDVASGIYEVTALDEAGCPSVLLVEVGAPPALVLLLDTLVRPHCAGDVNGALAVGLSGGSGEGYQVNWYLDGILIDQGFAIEGIGEGVYSVEGVDGAGCSTWIASIPLVAEGDISLTLPGDTALCAGTPLTLEAEATGATEAYWSASGASGVGLTASVQALPQGEAYWVFTAQRLGCIREDSVQVVGWSLPEPDAGQDVLIPSGGEAVLGAPGASEDWTYAWSPAHQVLQPESATTTTEPLQETTTFILAVTTADGCSALDTVVVEVLRSLEIPTGFTPNDDGMNDRWNLGGLDEYPSAEITVFNRWGDVLLNLRPGDGSWDGTLNGVPVPVGTYYYHIRVDEPALQTEWTGPITIMR